MATTAPKQNPLNRLVSYLVEVKNELDKVTWPSKDELKAHTTVVLIFLIILAVMIGAMDITFQRTVIGLFNWL